MFAAPSRGSPKGRRLLGGYTAAHCDPNQLSSAQRGDGGSIFAQQKSARGGRSPPKLRTRQSTTDSRPRFSWEQEDGGGDRNRRKGAAARTTATTDAEWSGVALVGATEDAHTGKRVRVPALSSPRGRGGVWSATGGPQAAIGGVGVGRRKTHTASSPVRAQSCGGVRRRCTGHAATREHVCTSQNTGRSFSTCARR
eukprot:TRINITY_DN15787_c0_g1_i1.p2 TRINITY_DN15787_c0_g1~~TRINITY_DN15787_c0_g1_i1.p2  ORF type:complete len:211 (+),score=33.99 TRINITY_DN15787_c0_g1_i1:45-635(+)